MDGCADSANDPLADRWDLRAPRVGLPSFTHAELREKVFHGDGELDACERVLAQAARMMTALELGIGELLAALTVGKRIGELGFSNLGDYAENLLGMKRRTAQLAARLARALPERPLLSAAVRAGEVTQRAAHAVLPVAKGDDEAAWVERAKVETVRRLEALVRKALREGRCLPGPDAAADQAAEDARPWIRLRFTLSDEDRKDVDEALALAGELMETPHRYLQLQALAQEYLSEHPASEEEAAAAEQAVERRLHPLDVPTKRDAAEAALELETSQWAFLDPVHPIPAVDLDPNSYATAEELDRTLVALAQERKAWDDLIGHCAAVVKGTRMHRELGFADFRHYATERLGLSARSVETRAALQKRIWERPELAVAKDMGLSYSKLLLLQAVPELDTLSWAMKAEKLTVVELDEAVRARTDAQMCARNQLEALVPVEVATLLEQAYLASLRDEGPVPEAAESDRSRREGRLLARLARNFKKAWGGDRMPARTVSQKQRRKYPRCCFPACSGRSVHGHHIEFRSHLGSDDPSNRLPLCLFHHLVIVHGGIAEILGIFPDGIEYRVKGTEWRDARFGRKRGERV